MTYIDIDIIKIISDLVAKMRTTGTIIDIADNNNNTYTLEVDNIDNIENNDVILIKTTTNFNGEFVVESLNATDKKFNIQFPKGKTIATLGTFEQITPQFHFNSWTGAQNEILQSVVNYVSDAKKFPCSLLLLDFEEKFETPFVNYPKLSIYFFVQTQPEKDAAWRYANTIPVLDDLYKRFVEILSQYTGVSADFDHTKKTYYYLGSLDKNQNKLGSYLDAIEITIENFKLINETQIIC